MDNTFVFLFSYREEMIATTCIRLHTWEVSYTMCIVDKCTERKIPSNLMIKHPDNNTSLSDSCLYYLSIVGLSVGLDCILRILTRHRICAPLWSQEEPRDIWVSQLNKLPNIYDFMKHKYPKLLPLAPIKRELYIVPNDGKKKKYPTCVIKRITSSLQIKKISP